MLLITCIVCFVYLHTKGRYVRMLPMAGRTAGPIKTKLGIGTHVDPRSVLVKVKVICLCVRYKIRIPDIMPRDKMPQDKMPRI